AIILVRIPPFDGYIASFDIAQVVQALAERCQAIRWRWSSRAQPSDNRCRRLLCARRERPGNRPTAEQGDELAALHRADPKPKEYGSIADYDRASQQKRSAHVRLGS